MCHPTRFVPHVLMKCSHTKAECTEERVDDRKCRLCDKTGHISRDCPDKPPAKCNNCQQEGIENVSFK